VLKLKYNMKGISLIEIVIALAIMGILFAASAPSFSEWIQNSRIRTAAESLQNGLTLAKSEAVHRNTTAQFVSCGGGTWDIVVASATANTTVCNTGAATAGWERIQISASQSESSNALVDTTQSTIGFNGMGRQVATTDLVNAAATPNPPVAVNINVSATLAGAACTCPAGDCGYPAGITFASTGKLRCLRISVSSGGLMRMCDPAITAGTPQGC
jgi:type IV fimbrial biogenesis protein FimT